MDIFPGKILEELDLLILCVCLYVCQHASISPELQHYYSDTSDLHQSFVYCKPPTTYMAGGSVLLWRRCDTLCTSGFMEDIMFAHDGQEWATR